MDPAERAGRARLRSVLVVLAVVVAAHLLIALGQLTTSYPIEIRHAQYCDELTATCGPVLQVWVENRAASPHVLLDPLALLTSVLLVVALVRLRRAARPLAPGGGGALVVAVVTSVAAALACTGGLALSENESARGMLAWLDAVQIVTTAASLARLGVALAALARSLGRSSSVPWGPLLAASALVAGGLSFDARRFQAAVPHELFVTLYLLQLGLVAMCLRLALGLRSSRHADALAAPNLVALRHASFGLLRYARLVELRFALLCVAPLIASLASVSHSSRSPLALVVGFGALLAGTFAAAALARVGHVRSARGPALAAAALTLVGVGLEALVLWRATDGLEGTIDLEPQEQLALAAWLTGFVAQLAALGALGRLAEDLGRGALARRTTRIYAALAAAGALAAAATVAAARADCWYTHRAAMVLAATVAAGLIWLTVRRLTGLARALAVAARQHEQIDVPQAAARPLRIRATAGAPSE